jgi:hypothetical protein
MLYLWKARFLNLAAFIYTTGGGIVGAAATQYVTHVRDRRSARALVIEQIAKIEAAYAALRVSVNAETMAVNPLPSLDEFLASLEAGALIAGIPRMFLRPYIDSIRLCYEYRRLEVATDSMAFNMVKILPKILEIDKSLDPAKLPDYTREAFELLKNIREHTADADERFEHLARSSLNILSAAIWHPLIVQVARRKASKLTRALDDLNKLRQQLTILNEKLEGKLNLTSYIVGQLAFMQDARR